MDVLEVLPKTALLDMVLDRGLDRDDVNRPLCLVPRGAFIGNPICLRVPIYSAMTGNPLKS